jgi:hypothetical protein
MSIAIRAHGERLELSDLYEGIVLKAERTCPVTIKESAGFLIIKTLAGDYLVDPLTGEIYPSNELTKAYTINENNAAYLAKLFGENRVVASPVLEPDESNPRGVYWQIATPTGWVPASPGDRIVRCGLEMLELAVVPKDAPLPVA